MNMLQTLGPSVPLLLGAARNSMLAEKRSLCGHENLNVASFLKISTQSDWRTDVFSF